MYRIFISGLVYDRGQSGISDYIDQTISHLIKNHEVDLTLLENDRYIFPKRNRNLNIIPISNKLSNTFLNILWHMFVLPFYLKNKKYDFVLLPAGNRRQMFFCPQFTIAILHDLADLYSANKFNIIRYFYLNVLTPFFLRKCDGLVAISENTKDDILKFYNIDEKKIKVIYDGYDPKIFNTEKSQKSIKQKLGIDKDYLLYISRIEHPKKNHLNLMKAYEKLPENIKEKYDLVFAGKMGKKSNEIIKYADRSQDRNRIKFLGYVQENDLPALYKDSSLFIYPSFHEGFGIPLIEAMACGIPIICSNKSALPEVGGEAVFLIDPYDPDNISDSIIKVLKDSKIKNQLIKKGFIRTKNFSWEKHVREIVNIYEDSLKAKNS